MQNFISSSPIFGYKSKSAFITDPLYTFNNDPPPYKKINKYIRNIAATIKKERERERGEKKKEKKKNYLYIVIKRRKTGNKRTFSANTVSLSMEYQFSATRGSKPFVLARSSKNSFLCSFLSQYFPASNISFERIFFYVFSLIHHRFFLSFFFFKQKL